MVDSHALEQNQLSYFEAQAAKVYRQYDEILSRNNAVDFDDLLMKTVVLFRDHPDVLKKYQRRYQHVLIDEFQDTNVAQYSLARLLSQESRNICVVGDADQSIYSWRHADIRNILSIPERLPRGPHGESGRELPLDGSHPRGGLQPNFGQQDEVGQGPSNFQGHGRPPCDP